MKTRWSEVTRRRRTGLILDPYYEWTAATKFAYYGKAKWLPILIELDGISPQKFAQATWHPASEKDKWDEILRVPSGYAASLSGLQSITFVTALVKKPFLARLAKGHGSLRDIVRRFELGHPVTVNKKKGSKQAAVKKKIPKDVAKRGLAITAVIDDGLAFAHERFRCRDKKSTRIEYFWDQMEPSPNPEPNWDYGREIDKIGIDTLLRAHERTGAGLAGLVNEDELYRVSGHVNHAMRGHKAAAWRASHGTHVLDLACGFDPEKAPENSPIIAVQLPGSTTADTSGASLAPQVIDALHYILHRANSVSDRLKCGRLPVVVNLSYGTFAGPHDGSSMLERAIDELIVARRTDYKVPLEVVIPSGNSHQSRCHACFCLDIGSERILHWRVQPDDATESTLEIWLPHTPPGETAPQVEVRVTSPSGDVVTGIIEGTEADCGAGANVVGKAAYYAPGEIYTPGETANRALIRITLAPTASHDPALITAPSGAWLIGVKNIGSSRIHDIHAWIERDDTPYGYPRRGRQSRFEDANYVRFDGGGREHEADSDLSYVKRHGSINGIATGAQSIVVGGHRRSDWKPPKYTAGGPIINQPAVAAYRDGPDVLAPSEDSVACHGVLAAGARSGSSVAMVGTSMAAPLVARWVARRIRVNPLPMPADPTLPLYRNAVRVKARNEEGTDGANRSPQPPAMRGGEGRIKLDPVAPAPPLKRHEK